MFEQYIGMSRDEYRAQMLELKFETFTPLTSLEKMALLVSANTDMRDIAVAVESNGVEFNSVRDFLLFVLEKSAKSIRAFIRTGITSDLLTETLEQCLTSKSLINASPDMEKLNDHPAEFIEREFKFVSVELIDEFIDMLLDGVLSREHCLYVPDIH